MLGEAMLRFAYWAGLAGVIGSLASAGLAWFQVPVAGYAAPYIVLFASVFVSFAAGVLGHPACTRSGLRFNLELRVLALAEPWAIALTGALVVVLVVVGSWLSPSADHFTLNAASLTGHVDRQLKLALASAAAHGLALCVASSGLRWGSYATIGGPAAWFARWLNPAQTQGASSNLPGAPFTYRTVFGRVTFRSEAGYLLTDHFPFRSRNRRIPSADVRGIQVNAELSDQGVVTHYSLLLIREQQSPERLVYNVPCAEHARVLAQQIDGLLRWSAAGTREPGSLSRFAPNKH